MQTDSLAIMLAAYVLLILLVALYFYWLQYQRNKARERSIRTEWANVLHTDIGGNLSSIKLDLEFVREQEVDPKQMEELDHTLHTLQESIDKLHFMVDLVNKRQDSLVDVVNHLVREFIPRFERTKIEFITEISAPNELTDKIDVTRVYHLYLKLKEVLTNCLRHAQAKRVIFNVIVNKEAVVFTIRDDGKGFDTTQETAGHGLYDLKKQEENKALNIDLSSTPGVGTTVVISVYY